MQVLPGSQFLTTMHPILLVALPLTLMIQIPFGWAQVKMLVVVMSASAMVCIEVLMPETHGQTWA